MQAAALTSRIDAVTVYRRGARVTRVADVAPDAAGAYPSVVRVGGLPLGLEDGTVRARVEAADGEGEAQRTPVAFDLRVSLDVPDAGGELRPADDTELEGARAEVLRLERQLGQIRTERARLDRLQLVQRPAGAEGEPPPRRAFRCRPRRRKNPVSHRMHCATIPCRPFVEDAAWQVSFTSR